MAANRLVPKELEPLLERRGKARRVQDRIKAAPSQPPASGERRRAQRRKPSGVKRGKS